MGKNTIRKKAERNVALRMTEDPEVFGIPAIPYMMEKLCVCGRGVMRPTGKSLHAPDGKGQTLIHSCTAEDCDKTEAHAYPWPRPDMVPQANAADPNVLAFVRRSKEQRAELVAQIRRAEAQGAKGVES